MRNVFNYLEVNLCGRLSRELTLYEIEQLVECFTGELNLTRVFVDPLLAVPFAQ